jgi:hypothetical protein
MAKTDGNRANGRSGGDRLRPWRLAGLLATLAIALSAALYLGIRASRRPRAVQGEALYIGSDKCRSCHETEFDQWKTSHHGVAMQAARDGTVLGDFNDATFDHRGKRWRRARDLKASTRPAAP